MFKFTENSPNVAMFVRLLEAGVIDEDRVPHLFNLREVVFSIYKPKVEEVETEVPEETEGSEETNNPDNEVEGPGEVTEPEEEEDDTDEPINEDEVELSDPDTVIEEESENPNPVTEG